MRRVVAALVLVAVAASLAACGGGDTAATPTDTAEPTPPPAVVAAPSTNASDTKSPNEVVANEQFPTDKTQVPQAILDRLTAKQPMLLFFYDSTQIITSRQREEVDAVVDKYRGLIDLVVYDIEAGIGAPEATSDPEAQKAFSMAGLLGIKHTPYTLFVDRAGRVTGRFTGFADRVLLEREVLRATE
ncbi:MAG: hypothetical protein Q7W16_05200 [Coriobacteriia bacterium]|nr:hypothetical protein [Coriobacteriia bacterium]